MLYVIGLLVIIILFLILYLISIVLQIRNMNRQLEKRIAEHSRQPITLELINSDLNRLAINMNQCFKAEETLRLNAVREEKRFREMIANISHDLRTPLTAIKGYQQLLSSEELTPDQRKKLDIAENRAKELGQLIEHFFEYSYLLNSEPEQNIEKINLTNLVTECLVGSITILEEKHLRVEFDDHTPPIYIMADREMVTRIVQNLIRNCIQHSQGNILVTLSQDKNVCLSFCNPVKNPSEIDVTKLFERFYTGDRSRNHSTGLGLSIVKLLSEQMGGYTKARMERNLLEVSVIFENKVS